jgi:prepilin-type processing-associated H-X9-DG protein
LLTYNVPNRLLRISLYYLCIVVLPVFIGYAQQQTDENIFGHIADPQKQHIAFYWKDDEGKLLRSLGNIREWLSSKGTRMLFAMNGGMYKADNSPLGLFIENGKMLARLNKVQHAYGNFYIQPNGIFYLTHHHQAGICSTSKFSNTGDVEYATQSGPMLVIDGKCNPSFNRESEARNIRNGVGIMPDHKVLFAISVTPVTFYEFAQYFFNKGCVNALYLDGSVSQLFCPGEGMNDLGGDFGVIIAVTE